MDQIKSSYEVVGVVVGELVVLGDTETVLFSTVFDAEVVFAGERVESVLVEEVVFLHSSLGVIEQRPLKQYGRAELQCLMMPTFPGRQMMAS